MPVRRHHKPLPSRAGRLFDDPERPTDAYIAQVDGASRGNPGPAAYGVVIRRPDGTVVFQLNKYLGTTTNNVAEYYALMTALDFAATHGITKLRVCSDSELLVRQMQGRYKVKSASLKPLHEHARKLAGKLAYVSYEHVPRELNEEADRLANEALDQTGGRSVARLLRGGELAGQEKGPASKDAGYKSRRIRARYVKGALHPLEPLDLPEGAEVELIVQSKT